MSRELAPFVKTILGVDISDAMVKRYNQRVSEQGILPEEMRAVTIELKGAPDELNGQKFDVIIVRQNLNRLLDVQWPKLSACSALWRTIILTLSSP